MPVCPGTGCGRRRSRSRVLTPSSLACLSVIPTVNLTAGCLHDCVYCYIRGYKNHPGESRIILYEDTLERLKREVRDSSSEPHVVNNSTILGNGLYGVEGGTNVDHLDARNNYWGDASGPSSVAAA